MPTAVPRAMPRAAPATETEMMDVAPAMMRLRMSRPNWSVPSQNWVEGPWSW